ncbi:GAF and HD-GYP domain-containing protein [Treponema primitia]|uniref:GAF and HD-GYP domain-containing protein n=1 Tax=Treponema primitia TaxID=88058 RepID=UPI0002554FBE|nr:HD family phosphohydrolase [Treponema primitia]
MDNKDTDFKSILRVDSELNQIQDLDLLLERILQEARQVVHADAGSIYVRETEEVDGERVEKLVIKYAQNDTQQNLLPPGQKLIYSVFSLPINKLTISGYCASTKKLINVPDVYNLPSDAPYSFSTTYDKISNYKTTSTLAIPLVTAEGRLMGVIQIINSKDKDGKTVPFSKDDEFLITHFAANVTVALQRAYVTRAMILRMIRMSELRDPKETGTHVNRVAGYAVEIYDGYAKRHNVPNEEREKYRDTLKIAAMLHDVGKVAISDMILKKPGRFTPEEYLVMQHHTVYGAGLFDDLQSEMDTIARDIALTHHENWDGTGYPGWIDPVTQKPIKADDQGKPLGRREEEIPLPGRIVALADVYDALCSRRVYKDPWTEDQVLSEIRNVRGVKFDPELTDVFFEVLPNIKQIQNLYPEQA